MRELPALSNLMPTMAEASRSGASPPSLPRCGGARHWIDGNPSRWRASKWIL